MAPFTFTFLYIFKLFHYYIIDFLIHETENYYNKRLILDLIINKNEGIIKNLVIANGKKEEIDVMKVQHYNFDHKIISDDNL